MAPYILTLNQAALIFFPSVKDDTPFVAQVMIRTIREPNVGELATFHLAQHDITNAVECLLMAHILSPLPPTISLEGENYTLRGSRREWKYGKGLKLGWGKQTISACEDKWVFDFEIHES